MLFECEKDLRCDFFQPVASFVGGRAGMLQKANNMHHDHQASQAYSKDRWFSHMSDISACFDVVQKTRPVKGYN